MKNKIIFASTFLSLALVVGSLGSVFANEVAPADNQPVATNEAEQPAENAEKPEQPVENIEAQPAENTEQPATTNEEAQPSENTEKPAENNGAEATDNKESAKYKYIVSYRIMWSMFGDDGNKVYGHGQLSATKPTNNPSDIVPPKTWESFEYVGSSSSVNDSGSISIMHFYGKHDELADLKAAVYRGEMNDTEFRPVIIDENGNITEYTGDMTSTSSDSKDSSNKAKKSKSPNTSDPASIGLGALAMVSALGGLAAFRRKK